jgi:hypothetical protein
MDAEAHSLFDRWVVVPFAALRQLRNGDGAFVALAMGFGLYERFITSRIHKREGDPEKERYEEASKDFGGAVPPSDFKAFWEMYRVGVQHYFHPKHFTKGKDNMRWGWRISEGAGYSAFPKVIQVEADLFIITIDPWLFVEHIIYRWYEHPELMDELSATRFGSIQSAQPASEVATHASADSVLGSTDKGRASLAQGSGTGICPAKV